MLGLELRGLGLVSALQILQHGLDSGQLRFQVLGLFRRLDGFFLQVGDFPLQVLGLAAEGLALGFAGLQGLFHVL